MTPGRYLRLRRKAAGLELDDVLLASDTALLAIERDLRPATDREIAQLRVQFQFDTQILAEISRGGAPRMCRVCGCTENDACADVFGLGCHWVERDRCSACSDCARPMPEGLEA